MRLRNRPGLLALSGAALVGAVAIGTGSPSQWTVSSVPSPNPKASGIVAPNVLARGLAESIVAQGATPLENGTADVPYYGYLGKGPHVPALGSNVEAQKTEPDKNTYLVVPGGLPGADPASFYGTHFLFQGHEAGSPGVITRVNLDADGAHRVTLLATKDVNGANLPNFDGSVWDPFAKRLLFTAELGTSGGVWQANADSVPAKVQDISGVTGRGGYEGIQIDSKGNVYIVEDSGGSAGTVNTKAKQPNSFIFRLIPTDPTNLTKGGRLQALQVIGKDGQPIIFHTGQADADITAAPQKDLAAYGNTFATKWVTVHDTAVDGSTPFDANGLAKAKKATPFKRPENGQFRPRTRFTQFYFTATGDTNADSQANADFGGWGGLFKLTQSPTSDAGSLTLFYRGDKAHTGLDNIAFLTRDKLIAGEDAGDGLHSQRNALDSAYVFHTGQDYSTGAQPVRLLAEGRDASATIDAGLAGTAGFVNEGDNEITGIHVSNGDPTIRGLIGTKEPKPWREDGAWRVFWTQQHGDNVTWEITR